MEKIEKSKVVEIRQNTKKVPEQDHKLSEQEASSITQQENEDKTVLLETSDQYGLFFPFLSKEDQKKYAFTKTVNVKTRTQDNKISKIKTQVIVEAAHIADEKFFPGSKEEDIYNVIRYFACQQSKHRNYNGCIGAVFTISQMDKLLRDLNKGKTKKKINLSLEILQRTLVTIVTDRGRIRDTLIRNYSDFSDGRIFVTLPEFVSRDIKNTSIRFSCMPKELLGLKQSAAKHIANQMILFFTQAGIGNYDISMNSILNSINRPISKNLKNKIEFMKKSCEELKKDFASSYSIKAIYDSNDKRKIIDYIFSFSASKKLIESTKRSNFFFKNIKKIKTISPVEDEKNKKIVDVKPVTEQENVATSLKKDNQDTTPIIDRINNYWSPSEDSISFLIGIGIPEDFVKRKTEDIQIYFYEHSASRKKPTEARYRRWVKEDWDKVKNKSNNIGVKEFLPSKEIQALASFQNKFSEFKLYYDEVGELRTAEEWQALFLRKHPVEVVHVFVDPQDWSKGKEKIYRWKNA